MASRALQVLDIIHKAIMVPVRPRPARQCTATAPSSCSQMARKRSTTYVCVCMMYVCVYVSMYVCKHACMHACMFHLSMRNHLPPRHAAVWKLQLIVRQAAAGKLVARVALLLVQADN